MTRRLLILGAGPTQTPAIQRAVAMGLHTMVIDANPLAMGLGLAHETVHASTLDLNAVLETARAFRPHGIVTIGSDRAVRVVAQVAHELGLPGIDPETAARANDKLLMRQSFADHAVPAPRFRAVGNMVEAKRVAAKLGFPVVVKPSDNAAQRGVQRVNTASEVEPAFREALAYSQQGTVLLEECIDGPEITVSSFSLQGKMYPVLVADRLTNPPPYLGIALAHVYPSQKPRPLLDAVVTVTEAGIQALGIHEGPAYTQLRVGADGPKIMEIGARIGGGREVELLSFLGGPDWIEAQIRLCLGETLKASDIILPDKDDEASGVIKFLFAPAGTVTSVQGLADARSVPGVKRVVVRSKPGEQIPERTNAEARQGYIIALAYNQQKAMQRAQEAADHIRILTVEDNPETSRHVQ